MRIPPPIKTGDKIWIVSPAGKIKKEHVLPAASWLQKQGYKVDIGKHAFQEHFQFAGTIEQRLEDFQAALNDPECRAIICSRGGYGAVQIVEHLDFSLFKKYPKWIVGFSDITVLHNCLDSLGFASIHGVMPRYFLDENGNATDNLISLIDLLNNQASSYTINPDPFNKLGIAEAELTGGNLSIISSLMGTPFELDMNGKVLFIEDINEYLYKVDRIMHQLNLGDKLNRLNGLVVGGFTDMKDNTNPFGKSIKNIIFDAVAGYDYPVCFNFPAGHGADNVALSFGEKYRLKVAKDECKLSKI